MDNEHFNSLFTNTRSALSYAFKMMDIAEEEIARSGVDAFAYLCPPPALRNFHEDLYRSHAKELIERCKAELPLEVGTKAEVLAFLSELSLKAPLNNEHAALMSSLYNELFPNNSIDAIKEPWTDSNKELLAELRRKVGVART